MICCLFLFLSVFWLTNADWLHKGVGKIVAIDGVFEDSQVIYVGTDRGSLAAIEKGSKIIWRYFYDDTSTVVKSVKVRNQFLVSFYENDYVPRGVSFHHRKNGTAVFDPDTVTCAHLNECFFGFHVSLLFSAGVVSALNDKNLFLMSLTHKTMVKFSTHSIIRPCMQMGGVYTHSSYKILAADAGHNGRLLVLAALTPSACEAGAELLQNSEKCRPSSQLMLGLYKFTTNLSRLEKVRPVSCMLLTDLKNKFTVLNHKTESESNSDPVDSLHMKNYFFVYFNPQLQKGYFVDLRPKVVALMKQRVAITIDHVDFNVMDFVAITASERFAIKAKLDKLYNNVTRDSPTYHKFKSISRMWKVTILGDYKILCTNTLWSIILDKDGRHYEKLSGHYVQVQNFGVISLNWDGVLQIKPIHGKATKSYSDIRFANKGLILAAHSKESSLLYLACDDNTLISFNINKNSIDSIRDESLSMLKSVLLTPHIDYQNLFRDKRLWLPQSVLRFIRKASDLLILSTVNLLYYLNELPVHLWKEKNLLLRSSLYQSLMSPSIIALSENNRLYCIDSLKGIIIWSTPLQLSNFESALGHIFTRPLRNELRNLEKLNYTYECIDDSHIDGKSSLKGSVYYSNFVQHLHPTKMFFIEKETDILLILVHVPVQNLQIISMLDGITLRTEILPCDTKIVSHNTNTLNHVFLYDFENPCNFCINLDGKICDFSLMKDQFWNLYLESRLEKGPRGNRNLCDTKYRNSLNKFEPKNLSLETQFDAQTDSYLEFMIESSVSANSSKLYYILLMSQNSFKLSIIDSENKNQKLTLIIPEDMKVFKFKQFRNNLVLALHDYITETIQFRFYKILTPENDLINQFLKNYSLANNVFINYMDYSLKIYPTNLTNIVDYSITDNHIYAICEKNLVFKIKLTDGQNHITVNNSSKSDTNLVSNKSCEIFVQFGNIISNNYKKFIFTFAYGLDLLGTIQ